MKGILRRIDMQLVVPALVLVGISLATLFTVSFDIFRSQLIFFFLSIGVFIFFTYTDLSLLSLFSKQIYIVSLIGFLALLFLGYESHGASRWLDFFGFHLQFSEIFKPFLAVAMSAFLAKRAKSLATVGGFFLLLFPIAFLIMKQPDLGSALIYVFSAVLTLMLFGYSLKWFLAAGISIAALIPLIFRFLHGYQQQRLLTFLHMSSDPLGNSYNAVQALIAVGSGMFLGKGLGQGTQSGLKFLPERHTDFIFATLSEDLGFFGGVIVIVTFGFLLFRLYKIVQSTNTQQEKLFVTATFSLLLVQCFVNIGMNIGILPIVGVPLPFVSYGGSSLISNVIFLGLASRIGQLRKTNPALEIR